MAPTATTRRAAAKPAPEPEVVEDEDFEELEDDGDDLEELEEDDEVEAAPAPKAKSSKAKPAAKATAPKQPVIAFGSAELAAHVTEATGETYDARGIRMLLRKLAKDGKLPRVVGEDRNRYSFTGPEDETVKAVVAMVKSGAAKELKQAGLQKVKEDAAKKKAAAKAAKEAAEAEVEDDDMEEVEEEEAPKPRARRAAPAKAAPAKATPATARRRTAQK
jgi:hypothetical protein